MAVPTYLLVDHLVSVLMVEQVHYSSYFVMRFDSTVLTISSLRHGPGSCGNYNC